MNCSAWGDLGARVSQDVSKGSSVTLYLLSCAVNSLHDVGIRCYKAGRESRLLFSITSIHPQSSITSLDSQFYKRPHYNTNLLHREQFSALIMCSIYIFTYDCGCKQQEDGVVPCAHQGSCGGVKEQVRERKGFQCPRHGGRT